MSLSLYGVDIVSSGNGTGDGKLSLSDSSLSGVSVRSLAVSFGSSFSSRFRTGADDDGYFTSDLSLVVRC